MENLTETLTQFIRPELLILAPVLYILGIGLKKSESVSDKRIPLALGAVGIALSLAYVLGTSTLAGWRDVLLGVFTSVTQGILCAGASVYVSQLIKQATKGE